MRRGDRHVVDRPRGFKHEPRIGIVQKPGEPTESASRRRASKTPHAHSGRLVMRRFLPSRAASPEPTSPITPACRRYGSSSSLPCSIRSSGSIACARPSLPRAMAAKNRTRGLASSSRPNQAVQGQRLSQVSGNLGGLGPHLGVASASKGSSTGHWLARPPPVGAGQPGPSPRSRESGRAESLRPPRATSASFCPSSSRARPARTAPAGALACPGVRAARPRSSSDRWASPRASSVLTSRTSARSRLAGSPTR